MSVGIICMGLMVGFLVGLTGVGGAALLTPILVMLGINPSIAVGTDLMYNSITKLFGSIQHLRQKTVNLPIVKYLAMGSIPGAVMAVGLLYYSDQLFQNQEQITKHALGYVLMIVAVITLVRTLFSERFRANKWQIKPFAEKRLLTVLIGAILGFIVGLTSIGSGSLFALAMLYFFQLQASELVGTDIVHAFLLVTVAGFLHAGLGNVDYLLAANLLLGSVPGVIIGSSLSAKVPAKPLRAVIATLIFVSGCKLIV